MHVHVWDCYMLLPDSKKTKTQNEHPWSISRVPGTVMLCKSAPRNDHGTVIASSAPSSVWTKNLTKDMRGTTSTRKQPSSFQPQTSHDCIPVQTCVRSFYLRNIELHKWHHQYTYKIKKQKNKSTWVRNLFNHQIPRIAEDRIQLIRHRGLASQCCWWHWMWSSCCVVAPKLSVVYGTDPRLCLSSAVFVAVTSADVGHFNVNLHTIRMHENPWWIFEYIEIYYDITIYYHIFPTLMNIF